MQLKTFHQKYIYRTEYHAFVALAEISVCYITKIVRNVLDNTETHKLVVVVTTKALKHLYDKRTAEEYDFILFNMTDIVRYPDQIYLNKDKKRGDFLFVKTFKEQIFTCAIEKLEGKYFLVTCFRVRNKKYFNNYKLNWSWRDGTPSS
ncbi:MAG: hypothetical protein QY314_03605 [Candidatus Dojkabacteria bacterium]|nr:MAG: hypothetical protein QY314_03605 [Candidatus Dojkabacteria bacterium]